LSQALFHGESTNLFCHMRLRWNSFWRYIAILPCRG
jgi:hypothetical protein